jgi:pSer/pThr/pTyr-binding forkhead associated (FHA) protein
LARKRKKVSKLRGRPRRPDARLVQFEERKRIATRTLRGREIRIGRDPTSDLIVDYANVSRHHAVVRELGDRNMVLDLGSTNGVRVNGTPIGGKPRLLEQGDVIELSDQVVLLYEEGPFASSTPWVVTAVAMLVLLGAAIGLYLSSSSSEPDVRAPSIQSGPERNPSGTDSGMPPSTQSSVPQHSGSQGNSRVLAGEWYADASFGGRGGARGDPV